MNTLESSHEMASLQNPKTVGSSRNGDGEDFLSTPSDNSIFELPSLSPLELAEVQILHLQAEAAKAKLSHAIELHMVARNLGRSEVSLNLQTGQFEVR
jgi:hypothetical protein